MPLPPGPRSQRQVQSPVATSSHQQSSAASSILQQLPAAPSMLQLLPIASSILLQSSASSSSLPQILATSSSLQQSLAASSILQQPPATPSSLQQPPFKNTSTNQFFGGRRGRAVMALLWLLFRPYSGSIGWGRARIIFGKVVNLFVRILGTRLSDEGRSQDFLFSQTPRGEPYEAKTIKAPLGHPSGDGKSWSSGAIV